MGSAHVRGTSNGIDGVGVGAEGPVSMLRFGLEAVYERSRETTESARRSVFRYDTTARIGLVSLIREQRCPTCVGMPWVELGPAAGLGLGLALTDSSDVVGHAFAATWIDVRLSRASSHPVLRIQMQRDAYSGDLVGGTQVVVGLGYINWKNL